MKKMNLTWLTLALSLLSGAVYAETPGPVTGLKMPESVAVGPDGRIFVSEIGEFGKDGDGQITIVNDAGEKQLFAAGLDDPKGLVFVGKDLYVADKTKIIKVSPDGQTKVFVPTSAFPAVPQFLNDLEADQAGNIYVSDSGDLKGHDGAIYKISAKGEVTLIANSAKNKLVQSPNGLLMLDKDTLLEVDFASGILFRVTISTGELKPVANGFGGGDGITRGKNGVLYVSDWLNGRVFSVSKDNEVKLLLDGFQSSADIGISADGRYILVPDMKAGELIWLLTE